MRPQRNPHAVEFKRVFLEKVALILALVESNRSIKPSKHRKLQGTN